MTTLKAIKRTELGILEERIELAQKELDKFNDLKAEIKSLEESHKQNKEIKNLLLQEIEETSNLLEEKNNELENSEKEIKLIEDKYNNITSDIDKKASYLESLRDTINNTELTLEGINQEIKDNKELDKQSKKDFKKELAEEKKTHQSELKEIKDSIYNETKVIKDICKQSIEAKEESTKINKSLIKLVEKEQEGLKKIKYIEGDIEMLEGKYEQLKERNIKYAKDSNDLIKNNRKLEQMIIEAEKRLNELNH